MLDYLIFKTKRKILSKVNFFKKSDSDFDYAQSMFPRVLNDKHNYIELTMFNRDADMIDPEYLITVIDKFMRVTCPDVDDTKRYARRNDREEIRRRLAMGAEDDYFANSAYNNIGNTGQNCSFQPSFHHAKHVQLRFLNDASSDTESHSSDSETCPKLSKITPSYNCNLSNLLASSIISSHNANKLSIGCTNNNNKTLLSARAAKLNLGAPQPTPQHLNLSPSDEDRECDFFTKQARLQIEARMALAQAKDMAHMQMEIERQKQRFSPITEIIRNSLDRVGVHMPPSKRRVSRQMLTDMNIAQLQIIVNELHTQIEVLNDTLVHYLTERDDLHLGQDAMLADIEDLTRYLGAKEQSLHNNVKTKVYSK